MAGKMIDLPIGVKFSIGDKLVEVAEDAAEGIGCVFGVACCGERGSIVGAGRGFAADKIIRNIHAHFAQLDFKQTVALLAKSGLFRKQFLKTRRVDILPDAENVKLVGIVRFGLNSGKHPKPKLCGTGQRGGNSAHTIVVSQREQLNSGGLLVLGTVPDPERYSTYFMKIDNVKFRQKVVPGDTLLFHVSFMTELRRGCAVMKGRAFVGDKLVAECEFMAQIIKNK